MDKQERFKIGEQEYVITANRKEEDEVAFLPDSEASVGEHQDRQGIIDDPLLRLWRQSTKVPAKVASKKGRPSESGLTLCKKEGCMRPVPLSKNSGVPRLFCSQKCAHAYHSLRYWKRNKSSTGWWVDVIGATAVKFNRVKPTSEAEAEFRYKSHLEKNMCPYGGDNARKRCPSHETKDFHSKNKLCLIYATLVDDMKETWAIRRKEVYVRQYTTNDGRWLDGSEYDLLKPHVDTKRNLFPEILENTPKTLDKPPEKGV